MKRSDNYLLTDIADKHVLIPVGKNVADFSEMITLNEMGIEIWNMLDKDISLEEIVEKIVADYEVTKEQAKKDVQEFLDILRSSNCIGD